MQVFKSLCITIGQNFPKFTIFRSLQLKPYFYYKPSKFAKTNTILSHRWLEHFHNEKMGHMGIFQSNKVIENFLWHIFNIF